MRRLAMRSMLTGLCLCLLASSGLAQQGALTEPVALTVRDEALSRVAAELARQAGATIVVLPTVADTRVSLDLHGVPLRVALEMINEVAGVSVGLLGETFVIRSLIDSVEGGFRPLGTLPQLRRTQVQKLVYHPKHLLPSELASLFGRPSVRRSGPDGGLQAADRIKMDRRAHETEEATLALLPNGSPSGLLQEEFARFAQRWDEVDSGHRVVPGCRGGMALPAGVDVLLGYDPSKSLVAVGQPAGLATMRSWLDVLDGTPADMAIGTELLAVGAPAVQDVEWHTQSSSAGTSRMRYALVPTASLDPAPNKRLPMEGKAGRPWVINYSRAITPELRAIEGCDVTPLIAADMASALVATDLKIVTLPRPDGAILVQVDPVFGDALLALRTPGAGSVTKLSQLPCTSAAVAVPAGQSLVVAGFEPVGGYSVPDACQLLTNLPLTGDLYRTGDGAQSPSPVVVVITPSRQ